MKRELVLVYSISVILLVVTSRLFAESKLDTLNKLNAQWIYPDDPRVLALDSSFRHLFINSTSFSSVFDSIVYSIPEDSVPPIIREQVQERMSVIDSLTPMPLVLNDQSFKMIGFYLTKRREMLARVLGLSHLYFPLFESELIKEGLPMELKHLAIVESALVNVIKSRAGALGLWQFMYNTGVYLGMQIDSYIDQRRDPRVSTKTAVKYLKYLHGLYDDWYMALAAYNAGPGNVNKAIRRSGGKKTFWEIYNYLPRETRYYVPAFIAVNYVMNYPDEYNLRPLKPKYNYTEIDTVHLKQAVSFDQISEVLCIPVDELQFLNPQYKLDFVPVNTSLNKFYPLVLPYHLVGEFIVNEQVIYHYKPYSNENGESADTLELEQEIVHTVKSGQSIGSIANKYGVGVSSVKKWNNLRSNVIHPRQKLVIKVSGKEVLKSNGKVQGGYVFHVVKKGDSLSEIAEQYTGVSSSSIRKLNGLRKRVTLYPGTKLKIKRVKMK